MTAKLRILAARNWERATLLSLLFVALNTTAIAQLGTYRLGEVIGLWPYELQKGDPAALENSIKSVVYPLADEFLPGQDDVWFKGDRGARVGHYLFMGNFDSAERRNYYYPTHEGPFPKIADSDAAWQERGAPALAEFIFTEPAHLGDYCLIGAGTVPEMPWIDLLGIHFIKVKPGMEADFELFVREEWNPRAHLPGVWILFYKVDRGPNAGNTIMVVAFESRVVRDALYPGHETSPQDLVDWTFRPSLYDRLAEFLVSTSGEDTGYTDWVLIR